MDATELFRAGKLDDAVSAQIQQVKANPGDNGKRLFLFELLAFAGDLERARRQIEAINYNDLKLDAGVAQYRKVLDAETTRRRTFLEGILPQFLGSPPEHLYKRLEAINALKANRQADAATLLSQADEATPSVKGTLNGKAFEGLRDCDDLFGPILEVMAHGDYYWLPLEQVETLTMNAPKFPRDLLWLPAKLSVRDGPAGDVFLPAIYPGSHQAADDQLRLGRATQWQQPQGGPVRGLGARLFLVGDEGLGLLEWRELLVP